MKHVVAAVTVAIGLVMWFGGANRLLWRHRILSRRISGRRWPVRANWFALTRWEWLRLLALAVASLAVMILGFWFAAP